MKIYHPDRVDENKKADYSEKFNFIHQAYLILSDPEQRKKYDEGADVLFKKSTMTTQWSHFLNPVTNDEIGNARAIYQNSSEEEDDIAREIVAGNGSITHLLNNIPFMRPDDEQRVILIIKKMIDSKNVPPMKLKKLAKK